MTDTSTPTSAGTRGTSLRTGAGRPGTTAAAYAAAGILAGAFGIHVYWALGGDWGAATAFGSTDLPPRGVVAVVAALIAAAGLLVLRRVGALTGRLPAWLLRRGPWTLVAVFALAGLSNLAAPDGSYAREWHVYFFGPLLLVLAMLCAVVARSPVPPAHRD